MTNETPTPYVRPTGYSRQYDRKRKRDGKKAARRLNTLLYIINRVVKPRKRGRHDFHPAGIVFCLILKEKHNLSFRQVVAYLENHPDMLRLAGLKKVPSKSTLCAAALRLDRTKLDRIMHQQSRNYKKQTLLGDATGISMRTFQDWDDAKRGIWDCDFILFTPKFFREVICLFAFFAPWRIPFELRFLGTYGYAFGYRS